jgi:hypothetical protein
MGIGNQFGHSISVLSFREKNVAEIAVNAEVAKEGRWKYSSLCQISIILSRQFAT